MTFIKGIGGAFIFSHRPKQLAEWYTRYLGMEFEADDVYESIYHTFLTGTEESKNCKIVTSFSIIKAQHQFTRKIPDDEPDLMYGDQPFMINFRASNLTQLVGKLKDIGIRIIKQEEEEHGHFVWLRDLDGNRVELFEQYPEKGSKKEETKEKAEKVEKEESKASSKKKTSKKKKKKS